MKEVNDLSVATGAHYALLSVVDSMCPAFEDLHLHPSRTE